MEFENIEVSHLQHALRGMRNAMSGWDRSDTRENDGWITVGEADRDLARRQAVHHMRTRAGIHVDLLLVQIRQQMPDTTLSHFLCFFEHEKYLAFPFVLVCSKDLRRGEEHRHMSVMPAGMRDTVILREARLFACQILRVLFDRQRIDICSHQNRPAILPAVNHADATAARYASTPMYVPPTSTRAGSVIPFIDSARHNGTTATKCVRRPVGSGNT